MARKKIERNISYDDVREKYYVTLNYGISSETQKQVKATKTAETLPEARKILRHHETARDMGAVVMPKKLTVADWLKEWMETVIKPNRAETTVYGYQNMLDNHIEPALGAIPLQKLTASQLQRYYAEKMQEEGLSSNTVRKHHDLLKSALKVAVMQDLIVKNPAEKVTPPKVEESEISFYTAEQLRELLRLVAGHRLEVLVKLAGYLGLRREEIMGLKWANIDFEKSVIRITVARTSAGSKVIEKTTKNVSSTRRLHMPEDLSAVLKEQKRVQDERKAYLGEGYCDGGYVFAHEDGRPFRPNYASILFTKFVEENQLPKITLHGLRHTFATTANALGIPMFDIGKALGHSTPAITGKIYTHLLDPSHQSTVDKIANELKETTETG
jgi:Site-specific recombinase XerD